MLVDYHVHGLAHGEFKHVLEDIKPYIETAIKKGIDELGFTEHDRFFEELNFDLYFQLQKMFPEIRIRLGLEVDFRNGRERPLLEKLKQYPIDYLIGSVHEIEDWPFDNENYMDTYKQWKEDDLYKAYFELLKNMAITGEFQVVGHLDLIKVFGYRASKDVLEFLPPVLEEIKKSNMAVEINTNGWHKPIKEVYPEEKILQACFDKGIPITLSSDSHHPEQVGRDFDKAIALARKVGYKKIATFEKKKMILQDLG